MPYLDQGKKFLSGIHSARTNAWCYTTRQRNVQTLIVSDTTGTIFHLRSWRIYDRSGVARLFLSHNPLAFNEHLQSARQKILVLPGLERVMPPGSASPHLRPHGAKPGVPHSGCNARFNFEPLLCLHLTEIAPVIVNSPTCFVIITPLEAISKMSQKDEDDPSWSKARKLSKWNFNPPLIA